MFALHYFIVIYALIYYSFYIYHQKTIFSDMFYYILQHKNIYIKMLLYEYGLINKYKIQLNIIVIKKLLLLK